MRKKAFRSALAVLLAFCLMFSTVGTALAAGTAGGNDPETGKVSKKNYVSLGDSMTNGYGLPGYDGNTGVEDYGYGSYANQFAEHYGFNHAQLAMSAMRAEDLHWLLELDYEDEEAIALTDAHPNDDGYYDEHEEDETCHHTNVVYHGDDYSMKWWKEVHEAKWNAKFGNGDYWTWNELCDDYRLGVAAYAIQNDGAIGKITDKEAAIVAKYYQDAVKNADVVSLGMGNGNFGVFMFGRILEAIGFGGSPDETTVYNVENAIQECDPEMQGELLLLIDEMYAAIEEYTGLSINREDDQVDTLEALANTVVYTGISFVLNYAGSVEAILQLNPNAEIILVALMNTFEDDEASASSDISLGDLMGAVFGPLNAYIAALPTYMQATENGVYADATFYYAETEDKIECLAEVFGEDFVNADDTLNKKSIIRDRFVESIVGYCDHSTSCVDNPNCEKTHGDDENDCNCLQDCDDWETGMVWGLVGKKELVPGVSLCRISLEEILAYVGMSDAEKAEYAAANTQKAVSIAVYLAFENAVIEATQGGASVSLDSVLGLGGMSFDLFEPVLEDFMDNVGTAGAAYIGPAAAGVASGMNAQYSGLNLSGDDVVAIYNDTYSGTYASSLDANAKATIKSNFNMLCMLLAMPETLSASLQKAHAVYGLLGLFARCVIGNGLGSHPSQTGHNTLAAEIIETYETKYTVQDETIENLKTAYAYAYQQALAEGKIDELSSYIDIAIEAVKTAKGVAGSDMVKAEVTEELKKSYELLLNELDYAIADLEEIKALVNNATDVDTAWADILALEDNLNAHYDNIMELAAELEILSDLALSDLNAVVNYYTALVKSIADEAYAWVANGVEEFNAEYAAWVEEMGLLADEVDPALGAAVRKFLTETPADSLAILYAYGDEAANKLFIDAAAAAEDAYVILSALASALAANGEDIYDALLASDEYNAIKADIEDLLVKIEGLYEYAKTHPVSAALYYEQIIPEAEAELGELYGLLYTAILNAMDQVDPTLAPMVDAAIDALLEVLGVAENAGAAYGDWLLGHTDAMAGELLDAFLANAEELLTVACPIIDAIIWAALAELENFVDGVIDTVETEINKQIAELEKTLEDLKAELENAADELKAEIEAQIKVVEDKIAELKALLEENIFENLSAVLKALDELQTEVEELIQIAKDAALDAVAGALGDVADALEALDEALTNWFGEAYEELKAVIGEWADELLDAIVDAAKEYAPELADAIYEYLYNNPEEVINFVKTYGPYVLDLAEKYGDEVLAVIGAALVMYGDELVAYIVENHEAILSNLVAWIDVHGENTAELLQVYAEALGLCDAVREQIAELEAALEDLKAELENASEEVKAEIEKQIAIIEAQIEALKDKLAELEAALNELIADIGATIEEVKAEIEAIVEKIEATIEEIKAEIETVIEEVKAAVEEAVQATIEEALNDLDGLVEELKAIAAEAAEKIIALIQELIYDATHGEYTITEDSSYVAIGDGVGYAELLADYLAELVKTEGANYEYTSTILAEKGSTIEDAADIIAANLGTIASADLISIGYGNDTFANQAINAMMNLMVYGVPTAYDWVALLGEDAAEYAQMALVDVYTKLVEQGFADVMIPTAKASLADSMMAAVETYAYNVAVYALYLPEVINAIHEINPDALVVIVGMSNPFAGTTFTYEDMAINVGEYVDYIVHAANIHGVTYATLSENVVYVPAPEAESTVSGQTVELGLAFVLEYLTGKIDFATTAVGHEYILEQIENALTITVEKKTGLWGDADSDGVVTNNDAYLVAQYRAGLITADELDLDVCDVDADGAYTNNDAYLIARYRAKLIDKFPVEE